MSSTFVDETGAASGSRPDTETVGDRAAGDTAAESGRETDRPRRDEGAVRDDVAGRADRGLEVAESGTGADSGDGGPVVDADGTDGLSAGDRPGNGAGSTERGDGPDSSAGSTERVDGLGASEESTERSDGRGASEESTERANARGTSADRADDRPSAGAPDRRADRGDDRPRRDERSGRDERTERPRRDDRGGRDERPQRFERPQRADRPNRDRDDRPRRDDRPQREDRPQRAGRFVRGGEDAALDDEAMARELLAAPELPEGVEFSDLDEEARRDLRTLPKGLAETVGKHLVAAGGLVDSDPEAALEHAKYAKAKASRVPIVREALGLVAYHVGNWQEALSELRAVRRMTRSDEHIAIIADAERALGRPERALDLAKETDTSKLAKSTQVELAIVAAGARRDLGQLDAAVVSLQGPDLIPSKRDPWSARLFYAYADNLAAAGRKDEAVRWFLNASEADAEDETDAAERAAELSNE
ncbi:hypothetical protein [Amycolatopsis sp. PS_44_ISF1]|uniref:hypothetical protein n=1 Tax=Amycolatopsis sp. PS_44_ISF1 TaxID=2974917 RepID=UPI0028E0724A|nr:hypothetical protein [Amycolatopsis sp. PS_44_ISF1]MDT8915362.1 hypothetical protein [Amycolatopsis sp. PS_44_ISF1]